MNLYRRNALSKGKCATKNALSVGVRMEHECGVFGGPSRELVVSVASSAIHGLKRKENRAVHGIPRLIWSTAAIHTPGFHEATRVSGRQHLPFPAKLLLVEVSGKELSR